MDAGLAVIGTDWLEAITKPSFDFDANRRLFDEMSATREAHAENAIRSLKYKLVEGIASCKSRGSNSLGLEISASVFGTTAYRGFEDWLNNVGITYTVEKVVADDTGNAKAMLLLTPARA